MGGTEGIAVVKKGGVHQRVVLWVLHQVPQVAEVTMAPSHPVTRAVLVQDKHLSWTEPALHTQEGDNKTKQKDLTFLGGSFSVLLGKTEVNRKCKGERE